MAKRDRNKPEPRTSAALQQTAPARAPRPAWLMWLIVLALPFVLLALLEAGLRLGGFGHDLEPLFIRNPSQPDYLQANPVAVTRFFTEPTDAPAVSIETAYFRARKAPGTFRVFVQGESSAAGFPYGLGASIAGVLDQRFKRAFPSRDVEVISTAMAAVNSYALVDFADEIIAQHPDAVVVYVGHNEFLGILGVGSSLRMAETPGLTRAFLAVRELRLYQLMGRIVRALRPHAAPAAGNSADTLMTRVAGERDIVLNSPLFKLGEEQFADNLTRLLARYRRAGIPVFIGTLVSDERDQMPLAVLSGSETDAAGAAKTAYHAAQDSEAIPDYEAAREGYRWARDLDPLRFRGPTEFNEIIARVAREQDATLVDVYGAFERASPNGLIGHNLVLEHVHPNLDGYFLLADAFFRAMVAKGLPGRPEVDVPVATARAEMPVSDIDRWLGEYKVRHIVSAWPFTPTSTNPEPPAPKTEGERLALEVYAQRLSWPEAQDQLRRYDLSVGDKAGYALVSTILADAFPFSGTLQFETAAALIEQGRPADALRYARRALAVEPDNTNNLLVSAHALLLTGHRDEGRAALERVLQIEPSNPTARKVLGELQGEVQP